MSDRLAATVVGAGRGGQLSLRALSASPHYKLQAVCDVRPEALDAVRDEFPGVRCFTDRAAMFAECPADIVCVATFPSSHEDVAVDALRLALKGILVEKPLGHTVASGRRILNAIEARGLPVAVPHGLLVRRTPLDILDRVRGGEIGQLRLIEIQCRGWDIINAGIHWLNYVVALTAGDPVREVLAACDAQTRTFRDGMQVETIAVTSAVTDGGTRIVMHTGDSIPVSSGGQPTMFRLIGTGGMIEFWGWAPEYRVLNARYPHGEVFAPQDDPGTPHQRHLDRLANDIAAGRRDDTVARSSLVALEICEAAYLSARQRQAIRLPLDGAPRPPAGSWDPGEPYDGTGGGRDGRKLPQ